MRDLRRYFKIGSNWDAVIVTDGSATTVDKSGGWGYVLIRADQLTREMGWGGASNCTNTVSEMMAVFWPLMLLAEQKVGLKQGGYHVHVISDSEHVVKNLLVNNPATAGSIKANRPLWMALHHVKRRGLVIHPHHVPRDTIDLNRLCHDLANLSRKRMLRQSVQEELTWNVDETMPD